MIKTENIKDCFLKASKGKRGRRDVRNVLDNLDQNIAELKTMLESEKLGMVKHENKIINQDNNMKTRTIVKPNYRFEQVIHHCVISAFKPVALNGLYEFSCGSIPGRGIHYGKKYMRKWIDSYQGKKMYILKFDIHHFFESVDHDLLKALLKKTIRDKKFLRILNQIIDINETGLPLGFYTSQWLANFYLKKMDHFIKQELKAKHYMRYMDDCVILGKNKKELRKIKTMVEAYLNSIKLSFKKDWQIFRFEYLDKKTGKRKGRFLDFMGFKFYEKRTTIRKTILKRIRKKVVKVYEKPQKTWRDAASIISYMGWFNHTDTYAFYERYLKDKINLKLCKKLLRKHGKKERKKNDRMERSYRKSREKTIKT